MKLIIDISEEAYKEVCGSYLSLKSKEEMRIAVKNGTQLQAERGDLLYKNDVLDLFGHGSTYTSENAQKALEKLPTANTTDTDDIDEMLKRLWNDYDEEKKPTNMPTLE